MIDEIEKFEELLKNKMIRDAHMLIKFTHNELCHIEYENYGGIKSENQRGLLLEYFQEIANKLEIRFELEFTNEEVSHIKWYHKNIWIKPINGYIIPIFPEKNIKPKRNPIPAPLRHEVFVRDGYRCLECGATNKDEKLEADHIISVSQGGTDELSNLQTLCLVCNRAKNNRTWKGPE